MVPFNITFFLKTNEGVMIKFLIRVSITLLDNRVLNCLKLYRQALNLFSTESRLSS